MKRKRNWWRYKIDIIVEVTSDKDIPPVDLALDFAEMLWEAERLVEGKGKLNIRSIDSGGELLDFVEGASSSK